MDFWWYFSPIYLTMQSQHDLSIDIHSTHLHIFNINYMAVFLNCNQFNPGIYLAILFYQPDNKLGNFLTRSIKKKG